LTEPRERGIRIGVISNQRGPFVVVLAAACVCGCPGGAPVAGERLDAGASASTVPVAETTPAGSLDAAPAAPQCGAGRKRRRAAVMSSMPVDDAGP
jgi:hypothetical protein